MRQAVTCFAVVAPPRRGKTRAIQALAGRVHAAGVTITGIVQPAVLSGDQVVRYDVMRLPEGDSLVLAERRPSGQGYTFAPDAFSWATEALARPGPMAVLDEFGLLEARGEGHAPALAQALSTPDRRAVLLAVRQETFDALAPCIEALLSARGISTRFSRRVRWDLDPDHAARTAQIDAWAHSLIEVTR